MTNAERQALFKKRKKAEGLTLVNGIWAKPENHIKIKEAAKVIEGKCDE